MARDAGMDLVEVSPNVRPPVCKIMDYGRHRYLQSKKSKQKHHEQKLKEVRIRPKTDPHDRDIKMGRARTFLQHGDKVQFTMLFRGRERFHKDIGMEIFDGIVQDLADIAKIERPARALGRRMTMVLVPGKAAPPKTARAPTAPRPTAAPSPRPAAPTNREGADATREGAAPAEPSPSSAMSPAEPVQSEPGA